MPGVLWSGKDLATSGTHILVLAESGLGAQLLSQKIAFVDLNRDELVKRANEGHLHGS